MLKNAFEPCIPTRGVRLFFRNGHDWSSRYPLITEATLRNRNSSLVVAMRKANLARLLAFDANHVDLGFCNPLSSLNGSF